MKLFSQTIPAPSSVRISTTQIGKTDRTASGRKVKDIVAVKRTFELTYKGLKPSTMQFFLNAYLEGETGIFEYTDANGTNTVEVDIVDIPRELFKQKPNYSQNVTITLEEV